MLLFCFLILLLSGRVVGGNSKVKPNVPIVGDEHQKLNLIEMNGEDTPREAYLVFQGNSLVMNFEVFDILECSESHSYCIFFIYIGTNEVFIYYRKNTFSVIINDIESAENENLNEVQKLVIKENGEQFLNGQMFSKKNYWNKVKPIILNDGRRVALLTFNAAKLKKSTIHVGFPPPPSCIVDFKIIEGIINTGTTTITKEIKTKTGTSSKNGATEHNQDSFKRIIEKLNKHNAGISFKAGFKLGSFLNIGTSASYNYERQDKDKSESSSLYDITSFIENSVHKEEEVKITYVFPKRTSTIIKQLYMKCLEFIIDTGVILIDQVKLPEDGKNGTVDDVVGNEARNRYNSTTAVSGADSYLLVLHGFIGVLFGAFYMI